MVRRLGGEKYKIESEKEEDECLTSKAIPVPLLSRSLPSLPVNETTGELVDGSTTDSNLPTSQNNLIRINVMLPIAKMEPASRENTAPTTRLDLQGTQTICGHKKVATPSTLHKRIISRRSEKELQEKEAYERHRIANQNRNALRTPCRSRVPKQNVKSVATLASCIPIGGYMPEDPSLPSSFRQSKPKVYRSSFNPQDTRRQQTECAIVSTNNAIEHNASDVVESRKSLSPRHKNGYGKQEKATLVSLTNVQQYSTFMLDFDESNWIQEDESDEEEVPEVDPNRPVFQIQLTSWKALSDEEKMMELIAASKCRCIHEDAELDGVYIPSQQDFTNPTDVSAQLGVRSFMRWFSSSHRKRQHIRERFLMEELLCAARGDTVDTVDEEYREAGRLLPDEEHIGNNTSQEWYDFTTWYSTGLLPDQDTHDVDEIAELQSNRRCNRKVFLESQLEVLEDNKRQLDEQYAKYPQMGPPSQVFLFEKVKICEPDPVLLLSAYFNLSPELQEKELTLAICDPLVQIAAAMENIDLPDVTGLVMEEVDVLLLAANFQKWWSIPGNTHRADFLERESEQAAMDSQVQSELASEKTPGKEIEFKEAYYSSPTARLGFLTRIMLRLRRQQRIEHPSELGKFPVPTMFYITPPPVVMTNCNPQAFGHAPRRTVTVQSNMQVRPGESIQSDVEEELFVDSDSEYSEFNDREVDSEVEEDSLAYLEEIELMAEEDEMSGKLGFEIKQVVLEIVKTPIVFYDEPKVIPEPEEVEVEVDEEVENELQRRLEEERLQRLAEEKRLEEERAKKEHLRLLLLKKKEQEMKRAQEMKEAEKQRRLMEDLQRQEDLRLMRIEEETEKKRLAMMTEERLKMKKEDLLAAKLRSYMNKLEKEEQQQQAKSVLAMTGEDEYSRLLNTYLDDMEQQERARAEFLRELYTEFDPYYPTSRESSEIYLPSLKRRIREQEERKRRGRIDYPDVRCKSQYEVEQEQYLARDSRKFKQLMGLPLVTKEGKKTLKQPSEVEIIEAQRVAHGLEPPVERKERRKLPDLMKWKTSRSKYTVPVKTQKKQVQQEEPQALPFFRGNMLVKGQGKSKT